MRLPLTQGPHKRQKTPSRPPVYADTVPTLSLFDVSTKKPASCNQRNVKEQTNSRAPHSASRSQRPRRVRTRKIIILLTSCPSCRNENSSDGMVQLSDGTQVCRKCGHVIFPLGSGFQCECIRCIELRKTPSPAPQIAVA